MVIYKDFCGDFIGYHEDLWWSIGIYRGIIGIYRDTMGIYRDLYGI